MRLPGRRFGIIKPLILDKSPACLKEPKFVFVLRSWFKSAINLAIEEQVSQAVEFRNASCKTKHSLWTYGSFAKLRRISVLEIRTGRDGGLMVSVLDSGASDPGWSPGLGHCVVFLGKTLYSHSASLHPGV